MVPSENPVFLDVTTGRVLGKPKAAGGATSSVPRLLTPADATAAEAVDNASVGTDLPIAPGADYDPAAADAAAAQAAAANAEALAAEAEGGGEGRREGGREGRRRGRQEGEGSRCREQPLAGLDDHRRDRVLGGCRPRRGAGGVMASPVAAA